MTTAQEYVNRVVDIMPRGTPLRSQISVELQGHIAERVAHGVSLDAVLLQLGDPVRLAESYLSAEPLVSAPFGRRAAAKIIDVLSMLAILGPIAWWVASFDGFLALLLIPFGGSLLFGLSTLIAEVRFGQTLGKHLLGIRVVRETGARIGVGQSIVRQLPLFLQIYWIDVLFALFTEKSQRAFELLSKTRVIVAEGERS